MTSLPPTGYAALRRYREFGFHIFRDCGRLSRSTVALVYRSEAMRVCRVCLRRAGLDERGDAAPGELMEAYGR